VTCDEAIRAIEAMIDREIDDDERMQLEAHLAGCESCRRETEERRAFSDRVARDLNDAFPPSAQAAPRVIIRPRRFPWVRAAAVVLVGITVGYAGSASGFFRPATAEAREVADLSALKEAYEHRDQELTARLGQDAALLDRAVARAPEGPRRDLGALYVMHAASKLAGNETLALPQDPQARARTVASWLSSKDPALRGQAVLALRRLAAADVIHLENQIVNLKGADRTFAELYVRSVQAPAEPAIDVVVESEGRTLRVVQLQDAHIRVEATGAAAPKVYEGCNLLDFQARNPAIALQLKLRGVDGNFTVVGVQQVAPGVESRPAAYVPAVVWNAPAADSGGLVEALCAQAVLAECARAGRSVEESERRAMEVLQRVHAAPTDAKTSVRPDAARARRFLVEVRRLDAARLALARERLNDDVAELEKRVMETERRIDCVRKALITLEYQGKPK